MSEEMKVTIDQGSGDETAVVLRIGNEIFLIPDPFASALAQDYLVQSNQAAELAWLQDAVIVLEEGAEPMAGDLCYDYTGVLYRAESRNFNECYEIIQRNGKPVVYKPKELI